MNIQLHHQFFDFTGYMSRRLQTLFLESGKSLPFYKKKETLVRGDRDAVLSRISTLEGWQLYRMKANELLATCDNGCFRVRIDCRRNGVNACTVELWSVTMEDGTDIFDRVCSRLGDQLDAPSTVNVNWCYLNDAKRVETLTVKEEVDEKVHPAAYPWLPESLDIFTNRYASAQEPILILYGPPGAGKTRLIRHILAALSHRRGKPAEVLYATDSHIMQSDSFFIKFMTEASDAMVIEDADHLLEPRSDGNFHLHRFLSCSDGLLQPHGRKMIFSTNLPSRLSIDEALLRPGRCFSCVPARKLTTGEARNLVVEIVEGDDFLADMTNQHLGQNGVQSYSVAEIYAAVSEARHKSRQSSTSLITADTTARNAVPA